ncbi:hypothetical protein [Parasphingorhabdus sp.]|uniref:hypothetical protein n=1 Tax=Parasphingorhabdus sp. TaxID=2709688 RepID=UPI003A9005BD
MGNRMIRIGFGFLFIERLYNPLNALFAAPGQLENGKSKTAVTGEFQNAGAPVPPVEEPWEEEPDDPSPPHDWVSLW